MRIFELAELQAEGIEELARQYEEQGACVVRGLDEAVTRHFPPVLMDTMGVSAGEFDSMLDPHGPERIFSPELRQKLARVPSTPALQQALIDNLRRVLLRLLGPLVHVSSTFHAQFKGGKAKPVDHGGYDAKLDYMEVHGAYLLHQDFTGANLPTSPSALTLWVGLNACPDWKLRFYPGTHRLGLLCHKWLQLDDACLVRFGDPVEVEARPGTAVIFNSLLLHGTGEAGPLRRVSCDIRFFPLCRYLPTRPYLLHKSPLEYIGNALESTPGPTLRAPLLEHLALLDRPADVGDVPAHSILNWARYLAQMRAGEAELARRSLERFVNVEAGVDGPEVYLSKFCQPQMHEDTLGDLLLREAAAEAG
jgi:hypothetical protein